MLKAIAAVVSPRPTLIKSGSRLPLLSLVTRPFARQSDATHPCPSTGSAAFSGVIFMSLIPVLKELIPCRTTSEHASIESTSRRCQDPSQEEHQTAREVLKTSAEKPPGDQTLLNVHCVRGQIDPIPMTAKCSDLRPPRSSVVRVV